MKKVVGLFCVSMWAWSVSAIADPNCIPGSTRVSVTGAVFTCDASFPNLKNAYRDPHGLIWGDIVSSLPSGPGPNYTPGSNVLEQEAMNYCASIGARQPSGLEFQRLTVDLGYGSSHGYQTYPTNINDGQTVIPNLSWDFHSQVYARTALAYIFYGRNGTLVGDGWSNYANFRCVIPANAKGSPGIHVSIQGAFYTLDQRYPSLGTAYRDPRGLVWGDLVTRFGSADLMYEPDGEKYCASIGARLPTEDEYDNLGRDLGNQDLGYDPYMMDNQTQMIPNLANFRFLTSSLVANGNGNHWCFTGKEGATKNSVWGDASDACFSTGQQYAVRCVVGP